jgi:nucleoid DNA-binding protein
MKKSQLIDHIVAATGLDKNRASKALDALLTTVTESLSKSDQVKLTGLGTFEMAQRKARIGRNASYPKSRTKKYRRNIAQYDNICPRGDQE